jgi:hypothetical protein
MFDIYKARSDSRGFILYGFGGKIKVKTSKYSVSRDVVVFLCILGLAIAPVTLQIARIINEEITILCTIGSIIALAIFVFKIKDPLAEWHASEHKLVNAINTIDTPEELTIDLLKKAPTSNSFCGAGNSTLKEPSEEKLMETLRVGQIYIKECIKYYENLGSEDEET